MKYLKARRIWVLAAVALLFVACSETLEEPTPKSSTAKSDAVVTDLKSLETKPEYPGGMDALVAFISDHLEYPKSLEDDGLEGKVFVSFIIQPNGEVSDVTVEKGFASEADEAAKELVAQLPKWSPGVKDGKKVAVKYMLPIAFQLQ